MESRGLTRLKGWPLVVIFGFGVVSCAGFIYAAIQAKSKRWTVLAVATSIFTIIGWILMGTWEHGDEISNGAASFVVEMWIAFIALAWIVSKDYLNGAQDSDMPLAAGGQALAGASSASSRVDPGSISPAGWHPDPIGRFEQRYWDGHQWTEHVANEGRASTDPIT